MMSLKPRFLFPGQQPNERIYLITRPHWLILAKKLLVWLIFVAVLVFFNPIVLPVLPFLGEAPYAQMVSVFKTIYLMFLVAGAFSLWVIYYLNFQIVTNERLVDVDQINLLYHRTSELHLQNIEDVRAEIKGFLGTLFDYGTIYVQTAGVAAHFEFDDIPNPHRVAKLILDLYERLPNQRGGDT
jgi:hypothetical protein